MINQEEITMLTKKLELKHQCLDQIYVIILMPVLLQKELLLLLIQIMQKELKRWLLKIMHHLLIAFTMIQCTVYTANVQFP